CLSGTTRTGAAGAPSSTTISRDALNGSLDQRLLDRFVPILSCVPVISLDESLTEVVEVDLLLNLVGRSPLAEQRVDPCLDRFEELAHAPGVGMIVEHGAVARHERRNGDRFHLP